MININLKNEVYLKLTRSRPKLLTITILQWLQNYNGSSEKKLNLESLHLIAVDIWYLSISFDTIKNWKLPAKFIFYL